MTALHRRAVCLRSVANLAWANHLAHVLRWMPLSTGLTEYGADTVDAMQLDAAEALRAAAVGADRCLGRDLINRAVDWGHGVGTRRTDGGA